MTEIFLNANIKASKLKKMIVNIKKMLRKMHLKINLDLNEHNDELNEML